MESTMMASEKRHLRMQVRRLLADIPEEDQYVSDDALFARFLALPEVQAAKTVFCFWGIPGKEPDTSRLVEQLVARAAELSIPIIIDEAYGDYMPLEQSAINLCNRYENLIVLRSFSKAHGLAGARIGYGIIPEQLCVPLDNITHPYISSNPARAIAQAALEDEGFIDETRRVTAEHKAPFMRQWDKLITGHSDPHTPIFLISHPDPEVNLKEAFDNYHIKVSTGAVFVGLDKNSVRLRVPLEKDRQAVLDAIEAIDKTY